MSIEALCWAFDQQVKPAAAKFVLVALSNNANMHGHVWPSIETLCRRTCLERKTVMKSIDWLEELGLLIDTGERRGATKQIKVYKLNGLDMLSERHYVYRVKHPGTGEFYIGVRSSWGAPEHDGKYFGSGVWTMEMRRKRQPLVKDVLAVFQDRRQAERYETEAIIAVRGDPLCKNANTGSVPLSELSRFSHETVPLFEVKSAENGTQNLKNLKEPKGDAGGAAPRPVATCFKAYQAGIQKRYSAEYPPSRQANGMLSQVVAKLGAAPALRVVEFYLTREKPFYCQRKHALEILMKDCSTLWLELQAVTGASQGASPTKAIALFEFEDGRLKQMSDYPLAEPLDVARACARDYASRIEPWGVRNIVVRIGDRQNKFTPQEAR